MMSTKELKAATLHPRDKLTDCDLENNFWPRRLVKTPMQLHRDESEKNPMRELTKPAAK